MITLTRSELIAYRASMPKHARGIRAIDELTRRLTMDDLRFELELEKAVDEGIQAACLRGEMER